MDATAGANEVAAVIAAKPYRTSLPNRIRHTFETARFGASDEYTAGITYSVNTVPTNSPPITAIPSGTRLFAPAPKANAHEQAGVIGAVGHAGAAVLHVADGAEGQFQGGSARPTGAGGDGPHAACVPDSPGGEGP